MKEEVKQIGRHFVCEVEGGGVGAVLTARAALWGAVGQLAVICWAALHQNQGLWSWDLCWL